MSILKVNVCLEYTYLGHRSYVQFLNLDFSDSSTVVYECTFLEDSSTPHGSVWVYIPRGFKSSASLHVYRIIRADHCSCRIVTAMEKFCSLP